MKYIFLLFVFSGIIGVVGGFGILFYRRKMLKELKGESSSSAAEKIKDFISYLKSKIVKFNIRFTKTAYYSKVSTTIEKLNIDKDNSAETVLFSQQLFFVLTLIVSSMLFEDILYALPLAFAMFFVPVMILNSKFKKKQEGILKEMPDSLDIIGASIEGGLSLNKSMTRYAMNSKSVFAEELMIVMKKVQLGKGFSDSLKEMDGKLDIKEVTGFVNAFIQAEKMGGNVKDIIKAQGEEIRKKRFQYLKKKAHEAPVKLLIPLLIFIFPVIFIVLFGPIVIKLMNGL